MKERPQNERSDTAPETVAGWPDGERLTPLQVFCGELGRLLDLALLTLSEQEHRIFTEIAAIRVARDSATHIDDEWREAT